MVFKRTTSRNYLWAAYPLLWIAFHGHALAQPSLASATFFGGAGDQGARSLSIQGNAIFVGGAYAPLVRYSIPLAPGAVPVWSQNLNDAVFFGLTTTANTVFAVGSGRPPVCGAVDNVGDVEGKSIRAIYDISTGNFVECRSVNYFPYTGGESLSGVVQSSPFFYAVGAAETCGFGNNTFVLSKIDSANTILQTAVEVGVTLGQFNCIGDSHVYGGGITLLNGSLYLAGGSKLSGEDGVLRPVLLKYGLDLARQWKARPTDRAGDFRSVTAFGGAIYAVGFVQDNGGDFLIEKYDEAGNRIWSKTSGGPGDDELMGVVGLGTRVYAVGYTTSQGSGGQDIVILEIDPATGSTLSTTLYGGAQDDAAYAVTTDGADLYVAGDSRSYASTPGNLIGQSDMVLLRYAVHPDYSVALEPATRTIAPGDTTTFAINLDRLGGFTGPVTLSVSGLPFAVLGIFSPNPATGPLATLTVYTNPIVAPGTYPFTVTATSGALTHTVSGTLVITNGNYALSTTPASQTVMPGNSTNFNIGISRTGALTGAINFVVNGLPAGAIGNFVPNPALGSTSALNVSTLPGTPPGTYNLTITGDANGLIRTTTATLLIPDFSLAATPPSQTVTSGGGTSYSIAINPIGGFAAPVSFTVSGLPGGASATFSPNPSQGGSTMLSIATTGATPAGTYPLTITGTSGALVHSTGVTLVVSNNADFTISVAPSSRTVTRGGTTTYSVTITPLNGFNGMVSLATSGLPGGVLAIFNPSQTAASSTLTLYTNPGAPAGTYNFAITGSSGVIIHAVSATLTLN